MNASRILRLVLFLSFFVVTKKDYAQYTLPNSLGQPLTTKNYSDVTGSQFLFDNWVNGTVKLANGSTYKDVPIKYNEQEDVLYFKNNDGTELSFVEPVSEFTIERRLFRNGYIAGGNLKSYYEVLSDGTVQLLKRNIKTIQEDKEYNSATVNKKFIETIKYYILNKEKLIQIKKDKKSVLAAMGDKQTELENYIKTTNLNIKDDNDLSKLINYYNSI